MAQDKEVTANRTYKSSVFVMVFQEKKELLELYNAVSGKHYEDPEELEINTLDNASPKGSSEIFWRRTGRR